MPIDGITVCYFAWKKCNSVDAVVALYVLYQFISSNNKN